jgi:hypothetical protein
LTEPSFPWIETLSEMIMKTKILSAVAGLAALAAIAGAGTTAAEAHGYRHHHYKPYACGYKWVKVYSKYEGHRVWKQVWGCGPRIYF